MQSNIISVPVDMRAHTRPTLRAGEALTTLGTTMPPPPGFVQVFGDGESLRPTSLSDDILQLLYTLEAEDSMRKPEQRPAMLDAAA
jgi:hypothetical protein